MKYDYKEKFSVEGKHCIVTGGAQGLSRGMAEALLKWMQSCIDGCAGRKTKSGCKRIL